jgi:RTX calcium-binding nonapeptide repeat (4 copies)
VRPSPARTDGSPSRAPIALGATRIPTGRDPCTITGSNGSEVLNGTPGADLICGLGGDDRIRGFDGDDEIRGGGRNDIVYGGTGDDHVFGEDGDDIVNIKDTVQGKRPGRRPPGRRRLLQDGPRRPDGEVPIARRNIR